MLDTKEQVLSFLNKCEELKSCKFIMATTKIKDLLKNVVNSPEIYGMFDAVTSNFNYPAVKEQCLYLKNDGYTEKYCLTLPPTVGERLAFIFCLLVEFDKGTINFNEFLSKFYPVESSYVSGYQAFCSAVIVPLQDAVTQVFKEELSAPEEVDGKDASANAMRAELISAINVALSEEISFIENSSLSADDKESGVKILKSLQVAIKLGDEDFIDALVCGYNYFVLYHKCVSDNIAAIIQAIAAYERDL